MGNKSEHMGDGVYKCCMLFSERATSAQRTAERRESTSRFNLCRPCGCAVAAMDHTGIGPPYVRVMKGGACRASCFLDQSFQ
jgi:hypothetical protein